MEKKLKYNLVEKISQGSFGTVYRGSFMEHEVCAIKKIPIPTNNTEIQRYFESECSILKTIKQKSIISVYDVFRSKNSFYIAMEFCQGKDLGTILEHYNYIRLPLAKKWIKDLLKSLDYLKDLNIVHRDIKPKNILLTSKKIEEADVKLVDFGFATKIEESLKFSRVGTPLYMAPEIIDERGYNFKADVWSLGLVVYQLLYGEHPFRVSTLKELTEAQQMPISYRITENVNESAIRLMQAMIRFDPNERLDYEELLRMDFFVDSSSEKNSMLSVGIEVGEERSLSIDRFLGQSAKSSDFEIVEGSKTSNESHSSVILFEEGKMLGEGKDEVSSWSFHGSGEVSEKRISESKSGDAGKKEEIVGAKTDIVEKKEDFNQRVKEKSLNSVKILSSKNSSLNFYDYGIDFQEFEQALILHMHKVEEIVGNLNLAILYKEQYPDLYGCILRFLSKQKELVLEEVALIKLHLENESINMQTDEIVNTLNEDFRIHENFLSAFYEKESQQGVKCIEENLKNSLSRILSAFNSSILLRQSHSLLFASIKDYAPENKQIKRLIDSYA